MRMEDASVPITDLFTCGVCEQTETSITNFLKHKLQHTGPGNSFVCQFCQISYKKEATLAQHYKDRHRVPIFHKRKTVSKGNKYICVPTDLQRGDDSSCLEVVTVDHLDEIKATENNIDVINLFTNDISINNDNHSNHDHNFDENDETDMIVTNNHDHNDNNHKLSQITSRSNNADSRTVVTDEIFQLKSINGPQLSYSDAIIYKGGENVLEQGTTVQVSNGAIVESNDNVPITCNVEIISIDEPSANLYIDDKTAENTENIDDDDDRDDDDDNGNDANIQNDFYFCVKSDVNNGKNLIYERKDLCCIYCSYQDMVLANLYQHMYDHHNDNMNTNMELKLQDNSDNVKLMKFSEYKRHCFKYKTKNSNNRCRNTETQDQAGEFHCTKCDKMFTRLRYLKKHLNLHKSEKPYLCDFCGKSFKTRSYLTTHHKSHDTKTFECDQCDFTTDNRALRQLHRQQHNKGSVLCDICGNAYCDKSTLTKHKRVHDPNRPYQCNYSGCTWRFMTEVMCRAHQRNHNTEGKFKCSICGYVFRHKHHMKRHEDQVHGMKAQGSKSENRENETIEITPMNSGSMISGEEQQNVLNIIKTTQGEETPTVKVVVESAEDHACLGNSIAGGQLVITTDSEAAGLNYQQIEISNVSLIDSDHQTLIIPVLQGSVETSIVK